jgi:hypothetical protein
MKVKKLDWISFAGKEAELIMTDGKNECLVFSQPCQVALGENVNDFLHAMDVEGFMRTAETLEKITRVSEISYFSHFCVARVIDIKKNIVAVGQIKIKLDYDIPDWSIEEDLVEFSCDRLDLW